MNSKIFVIETDQPARFAELVNGLLSSPENRISKVTCLHTFTTVVPVGKVAGPNGQPNVKGILNIVVVAELVPKEVSGNEGSAVYKLTDH